MNTSKKVAGILCTGLLTASTGALATNGMNLEGYGPVALGMGGASMAYDNGAAAIMNNPATLSLMKDGTSRFDAAWGHLGPDVTSSNSFGSSASGGTAYEMPAFGYVTRRGKISFGVGMFAQGGMGTEYDGGSAVDLTGPSGIAFATGGPNSDAHDQRSELGVGRLIFPVSYTVNNKLSVAGSLDYVWGGLDIMWGMDTRNFFGAIDTTKVNSGNTAALTAIGAAINPQNVRGKMWGSMIDRFVDNFDAGGGGAFNNFYWGYFDFSDDSDFTQETEGDGFAFKLGFTYQVDDTVTIGGTYHAKTNMSDFEGPVTTTFKVDTTAAAGGITGAEIPVTGTVTIKDFQWPETIALGAAFKVSEKWMLATDWKRLKWSDVMKNFELNVKADSTQANPFAAGFAGSELNFIYFQNWKDQDIIQMGATYEHTDRLTYRAGINISNNPIPNNTVNFLFPAIVKNHYTGGVGYKTGKSSEVNFALSYAPEVTYTESATEKTAAFGDAAPITISHSQTSWQLMYSMMF